MTFLKSLRHQKNQRAQHRQSVWGVLGQQEASLLFRRQVLVESAVTEEQASIPLYTKSA